VKAARNGWSIGNESNVMTPISRLLPEAEAAAGRSDRARPSPSAPAPDDRRRF